MYVCMYVLRKNDSLTTNGHTHQLDICHNNVTVNNKNPTMYVCMYV